MRPFVPRRSISLPLKNLGCATGPQTAMMVKLVPLQLLLEQIGKLSFSGVMNYEAHL